MVFRAKVGFRYLRTIGWTGESSYNKGMNRKNLDTSLTYKIKRGPMADRQLLTVLVAVVTVLAGLPTPVSQAHYTNNPPLQPGFPVMLAGAPVDLSSPTLADLDGDGKQEIVVGGRALTVDGTQDCDGWVYVYKSTGQLYWQTRVQAPVNSSPTVADLNKDGKLEVIVGLGGIATSSTCWDGGVVALHGQDGSGWSKGTEVWSFDTQDWLDHQQNGWNDGVFASPAVGDITGDGWPEVVFGAWDQCIYALDRNGLPIWGNLPGVYPETYCGGHGFYNEDTIWSSPALADVNGDQVLEIITGADITAGNMYGDASGGYVYILNGQGTVLALTWLDQRIYSSPAVADIDNDQRYEIVVGTGTHLPGVGYYVTAYEIDLSRPSPRERLSVKWRSPTNGRVFASPAIGDLNGDGSADVAIGAYVGDWGANGGEFYAWNGRTGQQLFRVQACDMWGYSWPVDSSPTLADIDGDGHLEVLFSHAWEVSILNHDGTYYTDYSNPIQSNANPACVRSVAPTTTRSFWAKYSVHGSPAIGDLDGNGKAEVVIAGGYDTNNPTRGGIYVWTDQANGARPWPMFHHDAAHTGTIPLPPKQTVNPNSVLALHDVDDDDNKRVAVQIINTGGGAFTWTATVPAGVTISPSSGTVTSEATVIVTVPSSQYNGVGTYNLGNIVFTATPVGGGTIINGNASVPVQLRVADLSHVFLPMVKR
ncbi:MAG: VCBS repeat-containing protein [Chloroflexi bacterium]|nr:VCBS repeat-containing protein [Chloroflexota bacterium]